MLPHDLLEDTKARALLQLPQDKFEALVASGRLPIVRAGGGVCFKREDVAALVREQKKAEKEKSAKESVGKIRPPGGEPNPAPPARPAASAEACDAPAPAARPRLGRTGRLMRFLPSRWLAIWLAAGIVPALLMAALVPAFLTYLSERKGNGSDYPAPPAEKSGRPFAVCVSAPGLVEAEDGAEVEISFEVPGKVRVPVKEGQTVRKDELVAELENADVKARLDSAAAEQKNAEAQLETLRGDLEGRIERANQEVKRLKADSDLMEAGNRQELKDQVKAEVAKAQADLNFADEDVKRYDASAANSAGWRAWQKDQAFDNQQSARAALDRAKARQAEIENGFRPEEKARARALLANAEAEYTRLKVTKTPLLAAAQAKVEQAKAQVQAAEAELGKTVKKAPFDGVVVYKYITSGETIPPLMAKPVVRLADPSRLRVRADVDHADYLKIKPGQRVKITADAFKDKYFNGTVSYVSLKAGQKRFSTGEATEKMDVKVVETIVSLDESCPFVLGLLVRVYFLPMKEGIK